MNKHRYNCIFTQIYVALVGVVVGPELPNYSHSPFMEGQHMHGDGHLNHNASGG